jgi:uncharacterized lipoprotein YddW (UPF0748 family)
MVPKKQFVFLLFASFFIINCSNKLLITDNPNSQIPSAEREFRAAWVATVANINWPSKKGLSVEEQKNEAIKLLDLLYDNNFNTVILQVRPQSDAFYKSDLEPWSYYLTGEQGKAPYPYYDPLEFWIEEAHSRGIELHAWLNPYRAHHKDGGPIANTSIVKKRPDLVVKLETGYWWLDPSNQETQDHSYNVVMDIIKRYDVDGIHFDDYFYPYPSYNNNKEFPDEKNWQLYIQGGGKLSRADWRRENVNRFIKRIYTGIKNEKSSVKFGISPFGFWRPFNPPSVTHGFDQYDELFADAKLWLNEGWIDYYSPQLYWPINRMDLSFPLLLNWWKDENKKNRHIWPGISIGSSKNQNNIDETINQIMITRGMLPKSSGTVHWSIGPLKNSPELTKSILEGPYKRQALVPSFSWLDKKAPVKPEVEFLVKNDSLNVFWSHKNIDDIGHFVVYYKYKTQWNYTIHGNSIKSQMIPLYKINLSYLIKSDRLTSSNLKDVIDKLNAISVSSVDKFGNESAVVEITLTNLNYENAPTLEDVFRLYKINNNEP